MRIALPQLRYRMHDVDPVVGSVLVVLGRLSGDAEYGVSRNKRLTGSPASRADLLAQVRASLGTAARLKISSRIF